MTSGSRLFPDAVMNGVVLSLAALKRIDLLPAAMMAVHGSLSPTVHKAIGITLRAADPQALRTMIPTALSKISKISERFVVLQQLFDGDIRKHEGSAAEAAMEVVRGILSDCSAPIVDDGYALTDVAVCLNDQAFVNDRILKLLGQRRRQTDFLLAFLSSWSTRGSAGTDLEMMATFDSVFDLLIPSFNLDVRDTQPVKRQRVDIAQPPKQSVSPSKTAADLYWVMVYLVNHEKSHQLQELCRALSSEVLLQRPEVLRSILIPYLRHAQGLAAGCLENGQQTCVLQIYFSILDAYLRMYVQKQPSTVENWSRNRVACSCSDCFKLNLFLISSMHQTERFSVSKPRRHHLHIVLDNARINCTHETERHTRPETLVVTKRDRRKGVYDAWLARCLEAHNEIKQFDQELLERILGERYEVVKDMHPIITDDANAPSFLQRPVLRERRNGPIALAPAASSRAGTKRKVEVIDLCDSE